MALTMNGIIIKCGACKWRDGDGNCVCPKLYENDNGPELEEDTDHLMYWYNEGGGFWVGPEFGCVHGTPKDS